MNIILLATLVVALTIIIYPRDSQSNVWLSLVGVGNLIVTWAYVVFYSASASSLPSTWCAIIIFGVVFIDILFSKKKISHEN